MSARPGETVAFKVSCRGSAYDASLVRFQGSLWPQRPIEPQIVPADFDGSHPGRFQSTPIGSWVSIDLDPVFDTSNGLTLGCHLFPTLPDRGVEQTVFSFLDQDGQSLLALFIDAQGRLAFQTSDS